MIWFLLMVQNLNIPVIYNRSKKLLPGVIVITDNIFYKNKIFSEDPGNHDAGSITGIRGYIGHITESPRFKTGFLKSAEGSQFQDIYLKVV